MKSKVVTRFAPSPTGFLHAGAYRTAIFSYLYARHNEGKFILRIEDTDKERSKKEFTDNIIESLDWLGLVYDEIYYQSERTEKYRNYLEKLIKSGFAYVSKEEEQGREEVIRFKNPNKKVSFDDKIRGKIEFDTAELKDFVIAKSLTEPLFHLAVVVDDFEMGVTDVIRGEDHISNTPRQILIQQALNIPTPFYAHLPLVLASDRTKLSKRKGALSLTEYRDKGYLKEALLNYISLVGWNPGTTQEIFSERELIDQFDIKKVHKAGAIFDETKLQWMNKEYMKKISSAEFKKEVLKRIPEDISKLTLHEDRLDLVMDIIKERISYFDEVKIMDEKGELQYYFNEPEYDKSLLIPSPKMTRGIVLEEKEVQDNLKKVVEILEEIEPVKWYKNTIHDALWPLAEMKGKGAVLWPFRVALSGKDRSPDPFTLAHVLGKKETLKRLSKSANI